MSSKALTVITITSCEDGSQDFVCVESVTNFLEAGNHWPASYEVIKIILRDSYVMARDQTVVQETSIVTDVVIAEKKKKKKAQSKKNKQTDWHGSS